MADDLWELMMAVKTIELCLEPFPRLPWFVTIDGPEKEIQKHCKLLQHGDYQFIGHDPFRFAVNDRGLEFLTARIPPTVAIERLPCCKGDLIGVPRALLAEGKVE